MSLEVFYSRRALEDLANIEVWLEQFSPKTLKSVVKAIIDRMNRASPCLETWGERFALWKSG